MESKNNNKKSSVDSSSIVLTVVCLAAVFIIAILLSGSNTISSNAIVGGEDMDKETVVTSKGVILGTEAIGGSSNIDYNTYFELEDGSILRLEDSKVYAYAKFNEGVELDVEVTEGYTETYATDIYGNKIYEEKTYADKNAGSSGVSKKDVDGSKEAKVYIDNYKYISDVKLSGKSLRFVE